jgi:hypothetical protein
MAPNTGIAAPTGIDTARNGGGNGVMQQMEAEKAGIRRQEAQ